MNVYNYVANSNPYVAKEICNNFGYKIVDKNNMGENLKKLVVNEGEPALKMILDNHPDKDIILELYSDLNTPKLDCASCTKNNAPVEKFLNADGLIEPTKARTVENNFSIVFLAGITVLAFAIISKK